MFVCNYDRKKIVVDHRQKYVEIATDCFWIEIADKRLRFLQTKHLQCRTVLRLSEVSYVKNEYFSYQNKQSNLGKVNIFSYKF